MGFGWVLAWRNFFEFLAYSDASFFWKKNGGLYGNVYRGDERDEGSFGLGWGFLVKSKGGMVKIRREGMRGFIWEYAKFILYKVGFI
ncbi:MAG: hypothetical protein LBL19_06095 [Spirochaetaceae bacterium]|nr:hypothetical protein [Spirochaetaceae bacterium]